NAKEDQSDNRDWCEDEVLDHLINADARDSDKPGYIGRSRTAAEVEKKKEDCSILENEWDIVWPPPRGTRSRGLDTHREKQAGPRSRRPQLWARAPAQGEWPAKRSQLRVRQRRTSS